ncbi:MAG: glycerol-phosphate dehydrogenase [Candidatus Binatota bacterium]|jgi:glycerol-1-phosphate dehydrogenase [NAD(P)+]|nr:glycerol-phosphate dehydrogenase [Candidatus Binatota bacterium]
MLISRTIQIPVFLRIGRNLLDDLPGLLLEHHLHFGSPVVVATPRSDEIAGRKVARALSAGPPVVVDSNAWRSVEAVRAAARERRADLIVGVGGGTPLDVAKFVAAGERTSFLSVPTTPSNDGIASPIAVIRTERLQESLPARMPIGVVADLDILRQAPPACVRAGVGDLLANLSAVADWELACDRARDRMDDFARLLALTGAEAMLRYGDGEDAVDPASPELLEALINGLVLSGIAMEIAGSSRPCSGAEHLFSHALDRLAVRPAMHGTQVGLGTLIMTVLRGEDSEPLRSTMSRLGLALSARDAGIADDEVVEGLLHARDTRPERYTLLDEVEVTRAGAAEAARAAGVI